MRERSFSAFSMMIFQETLIDIQVEGDFLCGVSLYSFDIIDDGIDGDLSGGSPSCLPELLNCGNLFDKNHTVCFLRVNIGFFITNWRIIELLWRVDFCPVNSLILEFVIKKCFAQQILSEIVLVGLSLPRPPLWGVGGL